MDITIKQVGQRNGLDRFILINAVSRKVLTTDDVSEAALRRFFGQRGTDEATIDQCLERARARFAEGAQPVAADDAEEANDDDLLFELGLGEEDDVH